MRPLAAILGALAAPVVAAGTGPADDFRACAAIAVDAERLACYDNLAGRVAGAAPVSRAAAVIPSPQASAPAAVPAADAGHADHATQVVAEPTGPSAAATPAGPPQSSFGLYSAEHPRPAAVAQSESARVVALGRSRDGHATVTLEGGELWELSDDDPLLAVGDAVTITRAAFGSYLLHTPTRRTCRARRLR